MLELNVIRTNPDEVKQRLAVKGFGELQLVDEIIALDENRRNLQRQSDDLLHQGKNISQQIGQLYKQGKRDEAEALKTRSVELKNEAQALQNALGETETELTAKLVLLPNLPHCSVPAGRDSSDNVVVKENTAGLLPSLPEDAKPHWDLLEEYRIVSLELGVKITGTGFPVYIGKGAKLQRALIAFFLEEAEKAGYTEMLPPHIVNEESAFATGQLPDKEGQMYHAQTDNFFLIPTAEVPLTNVYRDEILEHADLPVKLAGYTPCFRREAGSYGKDVRGLNRLHQFDKVEIVQITQPEESYNTLDSMCAHVEGLLQKLGLPYRILKLCGGDATFASALTYDFEVYSAAQKMWLEVSSVSNFETFQSNRLKLRYRHPETRKTQLAHTLNGSALALPRILAALLENNQTPQGIKIPDVLHKFTGFDMIG